MNMKTILLVCSAGMSTSLLVTKMEAAAKDAGVECKIEEEGGHNHQNVRLIRQHLAQTFENGLILALGRVFDFPSPGGAPCDKDGSTCYGAQCEGC